MSNVKLEFESIDAYTSRAKVFGGWILKHIDDVHVSIYEDIRPQGSWSQTSMCFVPDPKHEWDLSTTQADKEKDSDATTY